MSLLKKSYKIIIGIVLIGLFILTLVLINKNNDDNKASSNGSITVLVNNINNEIVSKKRLEYKENDTLFDLINSNYDLLYEESTYGHYILGFDDLGIKTDGLSSWIWLEVAYLRDGYEYNNEINFDYYEKIDVNYGIDGLEIKENMIIGFNERNGNTNTSIYDATITLEPNSNDNSNKINTYIIFGIILLSIIVIIFIVLLIVNKRSSTLTVKEMCILSFMAIILFVQEQALTFIPNFQFTFMLIALYASIFGIKKASLIVLVHVILDNLFMGRFNVLTILPMLLGYELTIILVYVVRNKKLIYIILMVVLSSVVYCMCFLVVNAIMLDINVYHYFIADIPFEILLIISNIFTLLWFYRPLEKCIKDNYNKIIQR